MSLRTFPLVAAAVATAGALLAAQQNSNSVVIPLSDGGRPALVKINMMNGAITVRGENRKDIAVTTEGDTDDQPRGRNRAEQPSASGLKRLTQGAGVTVTQEGNEIEINGGWKRSSDVTVQVPLRTNLNLSGLNGRGITVENVEGEIEVEHQNGEVRLTNVGGSVVANSFNKTLRVVMTRITADKAMAFSSFNGSVDVTLPANAKATLKMRSDNGDIYTDFDVQTRSGGAPEVKSSGRQKTFEINQSIYGTINGGGPEFDLHTFNGNIYLRKGGGAQ